MAQIYQRVVNGKVVKLGQYSDFDFVIYIGHRLYAEIDNMSDAYRMYNQISELDVMYIN